MPNPFHWNNPPFHWDLPYDGSSSNLIGREIFLFGDSQTSIRKITLPSYTELVE